MFKKFYRFFASKKQSEPEQAPKNTEKTEEKSVKVTDPTEKLRKRNLIIKWIIALVIIGAFIAIVVVACFPNNSRNIFVDRAEYESTTNNLTLHTKPVDDANQDDYVVELNHNNFKAYYYAGTEAFRIEANTTDRGKINFKLFYDRENNKLTFGNVSITMVVDSQGQITFKEVNFQGDSESFFNNITGLISNADIPAQSVDWWYIVIQLLPMILLIALIIWSVSRVGKLQGGMGGEDSVWSIGKSQAKIAQSNVKFSDVAGIEEEKSELIEIVDYLKNPNKYAAMGARTPRGVILYGPPGTGKTLLAKAVAGEAKVPFFQVSGSAFEDMLVGVGAKRVRDLFTKAKKSSPAIIFIDEIDSVASKRGKYDVTGGSGLADQTINQLLAEMDGFNTKTGVVVMAATNRLDALDEAILRPGRFDRHIQVNLPDIKEREAILKLHAKNKNLSSKVNLGDIARRTPGFSGAQLENVLNEATLLTVRENKLAIGMEQIDEAIDRVIAGPAKKSRVITEDEKRQIAYHEAGHALLGLLIPGTDVVEKITIIPRGYAAGYTLSTPEKQEMSIQTKADLLKLVTSTLGGRAAEEVIYGKDKVSTGASNDLYKITNIVRSMVTQLGMSDLGMTQLIPSEGVQNPNQVKLYSEQTAQKIDAEVEKIIQGQYKLAKNLITKNKKELTLLVEALLLLETIVKNQIDYIHKHKKLPEEAIARQKQLKIRNEEKHQERLKEQALEKDKQKTKDLDSKTSKKQ